MSKDTPTVAVLMAVRNRREITRRCLQSLSRVSSEVARITAIVVDDGSTDGTDAMIIENFPEFRYIRADGSLFWGGAMRLAELHALPGKPDYLLWLNDDAQLVEGAIETVVRLAEGEKETHAVICSAFKGGDHEVTYSGVRVRSRKWWAPLVLDRVAPSKLGLKPADSFNGNLVLIPLEVAERLGGIDEDFIHHYGDFDYGLRVKMAGYPIFVAPGFAGTTSRNSFTGTFRDSTLDRTKRMKELIGPKGYPPRQKAKYLRRHGNRLWPAQFVLVYAGQFLKILMGR